MIITYRDPIEIQHEGFGAKGPWLVQSVVGPWLVSPRLASGWNNK